MTCRCRASLCSVATEQADGRCCDNCEHVPSLGDDQEDMDEVM